MVEIGDVVKINKKNVATVRFSRKSACDSCGMCVGKKSDKFVYCNLNNSLNAKIGDFVSIKMGDKYVLTAAFAVYSVPLILVAAALLITMAMSEAVQIIGVCVGLAVGAAVTFTIDRLARRRKEFCPTMVEIVDIEGKIVYNEPVSES